MHGIAPHRPGGVGTPALASPTGRERKPPRGVWPRSLQFSQWPKERRDEGRGRAPERLPTRLPLHPHAPPESAPVAARPLSFPCGVWTHVGCRGRGAWGRAPHCAGSQAAGGACWAEGSLGLCRSEGDTGVRWRPTRACRRPRLGPPGLGWVLLTSAAGQGAAGSPQLLRRFAGPPGGLSPPPPATAWFNVFSSSYSPSCKVRREINL